MTSPAKVIEVYKRLTNVELKQPQWWWLTNKLREPMSCYHLFFGGSYNVP